MAEIREMVTKNSTSLFVLINELFIQISVNKSEQIEC